MQALPNILTVARTVAAPFVLLAFSAFERPAADWVAFVLFTGAAATDWFDGWLARRYGSASGFGKMLDPIADKAIVAIALAALLGLHGLSLWLTLPVAVILLRETLVSGLREYLKGAEVLSVTGLAKWKTTVQLVAISLLLIAGPLGPAMFWTGVAALWLAAALTAATGWDYFSKGIAHIRRQEA
jgi:CDP-diacylglycerol--glycerol-3-phosphate 3-phosphatidyltransferase